MKPRAPPCETCGRDYCSCNIPDPRDAEIARLKDSLTATRVQFEQRSAELASAEARLATLAADLLPSMPSSKPAPPARTEAVRTFWKQCACPDCETADCVATIPASVAREVLTKLEKFERDYILDGEDLILESSASLRQALGEKVARLEREASKQYQAGVDFGRQEARKMVEEWALARPDPLIRLTCAGLARLIWPGGT